MSIIFQWKKPLIKNDHKSHCITLSYYKTIGVGKNVKSHLVQPSNWIQKSALQQLMVLCLNTSRDPHPRFPNPLLNHCSCYKVLPLGELKSAFLQLPPLITVPPSKTSLNKLNCFSRWLKKKYMLIVTIKTIYKYIETVNCLL